MLSGEVELSPHRRCQHRGPIRDSRVSSVVSMPSQSWGEEMGGGLSALMTPADGGVSPSELRNLEDTYKGDALAEGTSQS